MEKIYFYALTGIEPGTDLPTIHNPGESDIKTIISIVLTILGALALLMIVVSGLRYILSAGDPQKAARAKNGIIFALAGLAVAIAAQAIVSFVVTRL